MPNVHPQTMRLVRLKSFRACPKPTREALKRVLLHRQDYLAACQDLGIPNGTRLWGSRAVQTVIRDFHEAGGSPIPNEMDAVARLERLALGQPDQLPLSQQLGYHTVDTFQRSKTPRFDLNNRPAEHGPGIPGNRPEPKSAVCECGNPAGSSYGDRRLCPVCMVRALGLRPLHPNPPASPAPSAQSAQSAGPTETRCPQCALVLCGCARGETPTRPTEIVLGGETGIDLFPGINQQLTKGGPSTADLWREQQSADEARRESLLRQYQDQQADRDAQNDLDILFTPRPSWR